MQVLAKPAVGTRSLTLALCALLVLYVLALLLTTPESYADTAWYASDIVHHAEAGAPRGDSAFWEAAHVLWRPVGYVLYQAIPSVVRQTYGELLSAFLALMIVTWISGIVAVILIFRLTLLASKSTPVAVFSAVTFICSNAVLNYIHTGSPYIPGLALVLIAIWYLVRPSEGSLTSRGSLVISGVAAALATCLWLPYVFSLPALGLLFFRDGLRHSAAVFRLQIRNLLFWSAVVGVVVAASYSLPVASLHISSLSHLRAWFAASNHGIIPSRQAIRLATGLPRTFLTLGGDGLELKRYALKDPYAPTELKTVAKTLWPTLFKISVFYIALLALLASLWQYNGKRFLLWFMVGWLPLIFFSVVFFEASSPERYLPAYPFLFAGLAYALTQKQSPRWQRGILVLFGVTVIVSNAKAFSTADLWHEYQPAWTRRTAIAKLQHPRDRIVLLNFRDGITQFETRIPFDPNVRATTLNWYLLVELGSSAVPRWRQDFAKLALDTWRDGGQVWISSRLFSDRPERSWDWAEGEDRQISWTEFPAFFRSLTTEPALGGSDGFVRLVQGNENENVLRAALAQPESTARTQAAVVYKSVP